MPGGIERYHWTGPEEMPVWAWQSPRNRHKAPMCHRMYYDTPLRSEYVIWLDDDSRHLHCPDP